MLGRECLAACVVIVAVLGCKSAELTDSRAETPNQNASMANSLNKAKASFSRSWNTLASTKREREQEQLTHWDWTTAVPRNVPRAEVIVPSLSRPAVAFFLPSISESAVALTSGQDRPSEYLITRVEGTDVSSYLQLHAATEQLADSTTDVHVTIQDSANGRTSEASIPPAQMVALCQATSDSVGVMRLSEEGQTWLLIRQDGVQCVLIAQIERKSKLLQVTMDLKNHWGNRLLLPAEVRAYQHGQPLQCLTAAETLDLLYQPKEATRNLSEEASFSFAEVSERENYRLPTNFARLQQLPAGKADMRSRLQPALATLPGVPYPGPAVLADARALGGFLMQREYYSVGQSRLGWILFRCEPIEENQSIVLDVDLGKGPLRLEFLVPAS